MRRLRFRFALALLGFWLLVILPFWLLAVGFVGGMVFMPDNAFVTVDDTIIFAAMYLPPLASGILLFFHLRDERAV